MNASNLTEYQLISKHLTDGLSVSQYPRVKALSRPEKVGDATIYNGYYPARVAASFNNITPSLDPITMLLLEISTPNSVAIICDALSTDELVRIVAAGVSIAVESMIYERVDIKHLVDVLRIKRWCNTATLAGKSIEKLLLECDGLCDDVTLSVIGNTLGLQNIGCKGLSDYVTLLTTNPHTILGAALCLGDLELISKSNSMCIYSRTDKELASMIATLSTFSTYKAWCSLAFLSMIY